MAKDYYAILGVDKNASAEDIKKAFRKAAHKYHPDKSGGDETKFKEANEAYQVLSNAEKRKQYDQFGTTFDQAGAGCGAPGGGGWEDIFRQGGGFAGGGASGGPGGAQGFHFDMGDLGDIFSDFFGSGMAGGGRSRGRGRSRRGADIETEVELDFLEAVFGVEKSLELMKTVKCPHCDGNKAEPGTKISDCGTCQGSGQVTGVQNTVFGSIRTQKTCHTCRGEGKTYDQACTQCRGEGVMRQAVQHKIKIPAGVDDGQGIRLQGKGEAGRDGAQDGDLYILIRVRDDKRFQRDGIDIISTADISFAEAALGATIEIANVDGKSMLKIPAGIQSGAKIKIRGKGVPHIRGTGRGDHIVQVNIETPKHLSKKEKQLYEELAKLHGKRVGKKGFWK